MLVTIRETECNRPLESREAVGIDFGTTHCVVALYQGKDKDPMGPRILKTPLHPSGLVPSLVTYDGTKEGSGGVVVGKMVSPLNTLSSVKRTLSQTKTTAPEFSHLFQTSVDLFAYLKTHIQEAIGRDILQAVVTVPAYFHEVQRQHIKQAAEKAGFQVLRLISEPTAAAIAYGISQAAEGIYGVYDWGGGTFDFSLLALSHGLFRVKTTGGDSLLGGDDIDYAVALHISHEGAEAWKGMPLAQQALYLQEARGIKEALSHPDIPTIETSSGRQISRTQLNAWIEPLLQNTFVVVRQTLQEADLTFSQLKGVLLVGGTTHIPYVQKRVLEEFGQPPLTSLHPEYAVALGAAFQAHNLSTEASFLLLDVAPLSLGVETWGGLVERLIPRHTPIPAEASYEFTTAQSGQTRMKIHVVQGERELAQECRSLGMVELSGIPPLPKGRARVRVSFMLDADGLLTVSAAEASQHTRQTFTVNALRGLSDTLIQNDVLHPHRTSGQDVLMRLWIQKHHQATDSLQEMRRLMTTHPALFTEEEQERVHRMGQLLEQEVELSKAASPQEDPDIQRIGAALEDFLNQAQPFIERVLTSLLQAHLTPTQRLPA